MIEKNTHIHKKSVKRILEVDPESKQVTFLDTRFYKRKKLYYPSITYILSYFPKNKFFEDWLKDVGNNADYIVKRASEEGSQVHDLAERYLKGEELSWLDKRGNAKYSFDVWMMFLKFVDFWETYNPKLLATEEHIFSDKYKYAGTCDLVVEINGEVWLIDIKTSNSLHTSQELQLSAYVEAWNECFDLKINKTGILWLKSGKRKANKDKMYGKGWELSSSSRPHEENFNLFLKVYDLWKLETPYVEPIFNSFPSVVKRKL
jgi:hypothetical protein